MANIKYSTSQIKKLLTDIHSGVITDMNLPEDLYYAIGDYFTKALVKGYGSAAFSEIEVLGGLRENLWLFSAAKTYQFTKEAQSVLLDEDGKIKPFNKFYTDGQKVYDQYNKDWATAEYNTVIGQSQMAEQWQSIEANKDILPYLTFSTAGTGCPECLPFEGLTAPVGSSVWNKCTPLLHFNCMCILIPSDDAKLSTPAFIRSLPIDKNIPKDFQNNPGKTGEIFTAAHPYFDAPDKLKRVNFGFDIPE